MKLFSSNMNFQRMSLLGDWSIMPFSETLQARKIFKMLHGKIACCRSRHFGFTLNRRNLTKALRRNKFWSSWKFWNWPWKSIHFFNKKKRLLDFAPDPTFFLGNILCVFVFTKKKMDLKPSFSNILKCLSLFDILFLVGCFAFSYSQKIFWKAKSFLYILGNVLSFRCKTLFGLEVLRWNFLPCTISIP